MDDLIWEDLSVLLSDDVWVEQQVASRQSQDENSEKLIRLQKYKISQAAGKIAKVREGFEGGIYDLDSAKARITEHQAGMARAEDEVKRLKAETVSPIMDAGNLKALRDQLRNLRDEKLDQASFEEKHDLISQLDVKVYPSEDVKSLKVTCRLNLPAFEADKQSDVENTTGNYSNEENGPADGYGKVLYGPPIRLENMATPVNRLSRKPSPCIATSAVV